MQAESGDIGKQVGDMIMHHITNGPVMELPGSEGLMTEVPLPHFAPIELGGLVIDLSPTKVVVFMLIAAVLLILMALSIRKKIGLVPSGLANFVEAFVVFIRDDIAKTTMGSHAATHYTPYLCTTFFFILTCNLLGLIPYGTTATGNVGVTATLAGYRVFYDSICWDSAIGCGWLAGSSAAFGCAVVAGSGHDSG